VRTRKLLVALPVLLTLAALVALVFWPAPGSAITRENFDRIIDRIGPADELPAADREPMTRADVEAILGPAGDYRTQRWECSHQPRLADLLRSAHLTRLTWDADELTIYVYIDSAGQVDSAECLANVPATPDDFVGQVKQWWRRRFG
jgi:hypothetical protein